MLRTGARKTPRINTMKLTEQQIAHFETFGFLTRRQVFTPSEMADMTSAADDLWQQARQEDADENGYQAMGQFIEQSPRLSWLADDDRIYEPMMQLLGDGFIWGGSEGNKGTFNETRNHCWHSDRVEFLGLDYGLVKHMIYLEPTTKQTGALRVVPGSHFKQFGEMLGPLNSQQECTCRDLFGVEGDQMPCAALESEPGDLVMFNHYLFHGVYHKQPNRRYIVLKYAAKPTRAEHVKALCAHHQDASCLHDVFRGSTRPRIRAMIENLIASETLST